MCGLGFRSFRVRVVWFTGHLYVTLDSAYFVRKAILNVAQDINLNFISRMTIEQDFERGPDSTRVITKDDISVDFKLSEKSKGFYARRLNVYTHQSFEVPEGRQEQIFKESAPVITQKRLTAVRRIFGKKFVRKRLSKGIRTLWRN